MKLRFLKTLEMICTGSCETLKIFCCASSPALCLAEAHRSKEGSLVAKAFLDPGNKNQVLLCDCTCVNLLMAKLACMVWVKSGSDERIHVTTFESPAVYKCPF